ncbi:MAG: RidA family protein [Gemmatimonadaceae bacterium]|nr:RidA family protein [Gemmatimonadaceae bacterium]
MSQPLEQPVPQGRYVPAVRHVDVVYTSGMTPRRGGVLMFTGPIAAGDALEQHRDAVRLATQNALVAAQGCVGDGERIAVVLQLTVFLAAESGFTSHSKVADFASEVLVEELGPACIGSRAAIGVSSLPAGAPVEVTLVCAVRRG